MKILNKPKSFIPFVVGCHACQATLQIESTKDLFRIYVPDTSDTWGSNAHNDYYFKCAHCSSPISVDKEKIQPAYVRTRIKKGKL